MRRLIRIFTVCLVQLQGGCPNLAVCPNIPNLPYPVAKELMISTWLISLQIDLQDIKERFESKYEKSLYDVVKDECSGHFMRLLLCIINGSYVEPE